MGEALCPRGERQMAPVWFPSFLSPTSQPGRAGDNPKDTKVLSKGLGRELRMPGQVTKVRPGLYSCRFPSPRRSESMRIWHAEGTYFTVFSLTVTARVLPEADSSPSCLAGTTNETVIASTAASAGL